MDGSQRLALLLNRFYWRLLRVAPVYLCNPFREHFFVLRYPRSPPLTAAIELAEMLFCPIARFPRFVIDFLATINEKRIAKTEGSFAVIQIL